MIQRIQSVFLFLAAACYVWACFLPIATLTTPDSYYLYNAWSVKENIPDGAVVCSVMYVGLFQIAMAVFTFAIIFCYKNRMLQSKLCTAALFCGLLLLALMLFVCPDMIFARMPRFSGVKAVYSLYTLISMLPVLWVYLANKFILRDEKKVRDADRLR